MAGVNVATPAVCRLFNPCGASLASAHQHCAQGPTLVEPGIHRDRPASTQSPLMLDTRQLHRSQVFLPCSWSIRCRASATLRGKLSRGFHSPSPDSQRSAFIADPSFVFHSPRRWQGQRPESQDTNKTSRHLHTAKGRRVSVGGGRVSPGVSQYRREYLDLLSSRNATSSPLPELALNLARADLATPNRCHCPTYVMLPLDTVTVVNTLNYPRALQAGLRALKSVGVDGVMVDVWWGIVEAQGPRHYDWSAYAALMRMVAAEGMKLQAIMSFHGCGGNVGDSCHVSLSGWVLQEADNNPDIFYTDRAGVRNSECLSLGVDTLPIFSGRSPLEMYRDFIQSFRETFEEYFGSTIVEVSVGLGPAGELRYPSYPEGDGRWQYPGIGEFQCYDKYMLASLRACAQAVGRPDWGLSGPHDSGFYNQAPDETGFFHNQHGSWRTEYGSFFLSWYAQSLVAHGSRVLAAAAQALDGAGVLMAAKLPGIHWWYRSQSHPAELTAGYYNTAQRNGYDPVVRMLSRHGALLNFTCVEMGDDEQPWYTNSSPESLLLQVRESCARYGVHMSGENALPRFDKRAYERIRRNAYLQERPDLPPLESFTFLRMGETLFQSENWRQFVEFVRSMDDVYPEVPLDWCALSTGQRRAVDSKALIGHC